MKIAIPFIFYTLLCFTKAYPNYPFQLKATGFQAYNNNLIYLTYNEIIDGTNQLHTDSTFVRSGSFVFEGVLNNPGYEAELYIKKMKQVYFFILDSGELHVQPKLNIKFSELVIPGSETNKLRNAINRMHSQNILNGKPTKGRTLRDIMLKELEMIKKEPSNFYSLIALTNLSYNIRFINTEEIAEVYYLLEEKLRQTSIGTYLEERLKQDMALHPGKTFPDFEFMALNGQIISADTLKEKTYLISFGATWCGPCLKGMPELVLMQRNIDSSKFQIVYINMDNNKENWLKMIEKQGMQSFINLTNTFPSGKTSPMSTKFSIKSIPFYLIIDRHKIIRYNSYILKDDGHILRNTLIEKLVQ